MKISRARANSLQAKGLDVNWSMVEDEKQASPPVDPYLGIVAVINALTDKLEVVSTRVVEVLEKPEPKREFISTVSRDSKGEIITIRTEEQ